MNQFPDFMKQTCNMVKASDNARGLVGYLFEGVDGTQVVLWESTQGGTSEMHTHDYDEYAIVVQGSFTGTIGGNKVTMGPGDECYIPAGVPHDGEYSPNYRAIDAFGGKRLERANE